MIILCKCVCCYINEFLITHSPNVCPKKWKALKLIHSPSMQNYIFFEPSP